MIYQDLLWNCQLFFRKDDFHWKGLGIPILTDNTFYSVFNTMWPSDCARVSDSPAILYLYWTLGTPQEISTVDIEALWLFFVAGTNAPLFPTPQA